MKTKFLQVINKKNEELELPKIIPGNRSKEIDDENVRLTNLVKKYEKERRDIATKFLREINKKNEELEQLKVKIDDEKVGLTNLVKKYEKERIAIMAKKVYPVINKKNEELEKPLKITQENHSPKRKKTSHDQDESFQSHTSEIISLID